MVGRWLNPDPTGLAPDPNDYRFVGNDAMNMTDPSGLEGRGGYRPGTTYYDDLNAHQQFVKSLMEEKKAKFLEWYEWEKKPKNMAWLKRLPPVPKELKFKQVIEVAPIYGDYGTEGRGVPYVRTVPILPAGYEWDSNFTMNTLGFHPHAVFGIRSTEAEADKYGGSGNQAMYDDKGKLITGGLSAGTADKYCPNGTFSGIINAKTCNLSTGPGNWINTMAA